MNDTRRAPSPPPGASPDWVSAVKKHITEEGDVLELDQLKNGDRLQVRTQHTLYDFAWKADGTAELTTDRADRPKGLVRIQGCALGAGTTIAPDRLFNGGSLEFISGDGDWVNRTTPILWIRLVRRLG